MKGKFGVLLMILGAVLLLAALSLLAYNRWDDWRAGEAVTEIEDVLNQEMDEVEDDSQDGEDMDTIDIDGYAYIGTLSIPSFGLELPVMSEWSYEGLKLAPGRYSGSLVTNDLVLCAHNYERHFGNLKNLDVGDQVSFTDVHGKEVLYEVTEVTTLMPTSIAAMTTGDWDLTLFTCTIGGQQRVTVRCKKI